MSGALRNADNVPRLHVVTDETIQSRYAHAALAERALGGGADCVQFREKRPWATAELVRVAASVVAACEAAGALAIVNDRVDVAVAAGAQAVHLGREDLPVDVARRLLGDLVLIGGTANSLAEAARVWETDVDYLGVGPVFGTASKANPAPPLGLDSFARIAAACPKPVIAIGGIDAERIGSVIAAGAHGVAVLSAVVAGDDPEHAARRCRQALDAACRP